MALSVDWNHHIESWQHSGLSQTEYCRQRGLNYSTFTVRLSLYRKRQTDLQALPAPEPSLIPVRIQSLTTHELIRLKCEKGYQVELPTSISAAWLAELLRCLA